MRATRRRYCGLTTEILYRDGLCFGCKDNAVAQRYVRAAKKAGAIRRSTILLVLAAVGSLVLSGPPSAPHAIVSVSATTTNPTLNFTTTETGWGMKFVPVYPSELSPKAVLWNFGDGTTSTRISPTHSYERDGVYDVELEMTFSEFSLRCNRSVRVKDQSDLASLLHPLERSNDSVSLHLGTQAVVFTELSLWVSGLFCLVAGIYTSREQSGYARRGIRESTLSRTLRWASIAWGVIAIGLLIWLKLGGY